MRVRFEAIFESWEIIKSDLGVWVASSLILLVIQIGLELPLLAFTFDQVFSQLGQASPKIEQPSFVLTAVTVVVLHFVVGMMNAGVMRMALLKVRGQPVSVGDMFRLNGMAGQMALAELLLCALPLLPLVGGLIPIWLGWGKGDPTQLLLLTSAGQLLAYPFVWTAYVLVSFVPLLIVDRRMTFGEAFRLSFETARSHFWLLGLLLFVVILFSQLGAVACGVGLLFTMPFYYATRAIVYNDFFRPRPAEWTEPVEGANIPPPASL